LEKRGENENSNPLDSSMFPLFCKEGLGELEIEKLYFTDRLYSEFLFVFFAGRKIIKK